MQPSQVDKIAYDYYRNTTWQCWVEMAEKWSADPNTVKKFGVGYSWERNAYVVPMRGSDGIVTGIRFIDAKSGKKWSLAGGRDGLFIQSPRVSVGRIQTVAICEGFSDTVSLASMKLGWFCIGRPAAQSGADILMAVCKGLYEKHKCDFAVFADKNEVGRKTAQAIVDRLESKGVFVWKGTAVEVPGKSVDVREWIGTGIGPGEVRKLLGIPDG